VNNCISICLAPKDADFNSKVNGRNVRDYQIGKSKLLQVYIMGGKTCIVIEAFLRQLSEVEFVYILSTVLLNDVWQF
jgi:hypothetical protein